MTETLSFQQVASRPDLIASPVAAALSTWQSAPWMIDVGVAEIDPDFAGGLELCEHYGLDVAQAGNCLILRAKRGARAWNAACLVPSASSRTDLGGLVRRTLDARQVSLLPKEEAITETKMEYGSITVIGLPNDWPVLIDSSLVDAKQLLIGSGLVRSKIRLPGTALVQITNAQVVPGLATP